MESQQRPRYPVRIRVHGMQDREIRPGRRREMIEGERLKIIQDSFARDAGKPWNKTPKNIRNTI